MCSATANVLAARSMSAPPGNTGRCRPASMASLISGSCPHRLGRPSTYSAKLSMGSPLGRLTCGDVFVDVQVVLTRPDPRVVGPNGAQRELAEFGRVAARPVALPRPPEIGGPGLTGASEVNRRRLRAPECGGPGLTGASEVNRQPVHRHCGLANDLGQGRMSVHVHPELLGGALDQLGEATFGDQLGDVRADCVHAKEEVGARIDDDLEEAVRVSLDQRLADGAEREL